MNKLNLRWVVALVTTGLWLSWPQLSFGLGLGSPVTRAILGDTLSVSIPVRLDNGESLSDECVKAEVWFGDDKLAGSAVRANLRTARRGLYQAGDTQVEVRTSTLINEPAVTVAVAVGCPPRITRRFVALVDPPSTMSGAVAQVSVEEAQATVSRQEVQAALNDQPIQVVQDPQSKRSALGGQASSFKIGAKVSRRGEPVEGGVPPKSASRPPKESKKATQSSPSPRLVLDPVAVDAQLNPSLQMSAGMAAVPGAEMTPELEQKRRAASAVWLAMNATPEELARDRQRLVEVEQRLEKLSVDSTKASEALTRVESQMRSGEQNRLAVYLLGIAVVGLIVYIVWRERRMQQVSMMHQTWLASQMASEMNQDMVDDLDQSRLGSDPTDPGPLTDIHDVIASVDDESLAHQPVDLVLPTGPGALTTSASSIPGADKAGVSGYWRAVSVDELIDLDQQVEFFMVLGQEESAIEVLEGYIHTSGANTPIPFLKLLEIYRLMGLRADYERTRMNFNLRFNAHAPLWEADPEQGHDLADYPGVLDRIQAIWAQPSKAMGILERSLMRQDTESYTFDLPAYKDLLLLYLISRDLVAGEQSTSRDVGERSYDIAFEPDTKPLMATLPMKTLPDLAPVLSLDLELGDDGLVLNDAGQAKIRLDQSS